MQLRRLVLTSVAIILGFGLVQAVPERVEEPAGIVSAVPRWEKGDRLALREEHTSRRGVDGNKTKPSMKASATLDLEVLEAGPEGFVVRWTSGRPNVDTRGVTSQPVLEHLIKLTAGIGLEIVIDAAGTPTGVRNAAEVRRKMKRIGASLRRELSEQDAPPELIDGLIDQLAQTYESEQAILDHVGKSVSVYFLPFGWRFEPGVPIEYEAEIPSPAGTGSLPSQGTLSLDSYNVDTGMARVTWTQSIDRARAGEAIRAIVDSLDGEGRMSADLSAAVDEVDISDRANYVIDMRSGWVVDMTHERSVRMPGAERIDRATIRKRG
jgi:hypothetical protein